MRNRSLSVAKNVSVHSGFTLIELMIVIAIVGILSTMASSAWSRFLNRWQLSDAQQKIALAIRQTQMSAQRNNANWQFSIHETVNGDLEWASHPQKALPTSWTIVGLGGLDIDLTDTTLDSSNGSYYVRFDYKGNLASRTRTLTLTHRNLPKMKRCLVMSTLLGKVRLADEQQTPSSSGRYCY